jgi:arylsulfatase A-like enzyme/Tfp pilus assembly protein PilF
MKRGLLQSWIILALCAATAAQAPKKLPPNVYLITIDTLRADHVHCYGYEKIATPAIDELAKSGIRFSKAFTPSPITNTSHTTILTGLLPSAHGVTDFGIPLAASHPTLAHLLAQRGYHTAAFIGAVILDSKSLAPGLDQGFEFYDNFPEHSTTKERWGRVERRGADVVKRAEAWMTAHPRTPQLVWIHLYDPHDPYEPPPPYSQTYKDRLYDGEIAYADSALANFLAYLKAHSLDDNAIIIVVGDHGESLGEHHEDTHGIFLYDSTLHVPLILKLPKKENAGAVIDAQVRTTDILPTVLDFTDAPKPEHLDGESLAPLLAKTETAQRVAFGETDYPLRFGWAPLRSVRQIEFKFIEAPRPELYDLRSDPGETQNTYAPWNSEVKKSRGLLADLRSKLPPKAPSDATVPQGTLSELRALGYLGPADAGSSTTVPEPSLLPDPKNKIEEQNLLHRAMLAADSGNTAQAQTDLQKVLELNPTSPTALRQLGDLELQAGEYSKAADHLKAARANQPNDAVVAYELGEVLAKLSNFSEARDALEASLKIMPAQLPARVLLGNVYLELKNPAAATDQFEAALLLDAKNTDAKAGLARAQSVQKPN